MSSFGEQVTVYRPQQIPVTAEYVVQSTDAKLWVDAVMPPFALSVLGVLLVTVPIARALSTAMTPGEVLVGSGLFALAWTFSAFRARLKQADQAKQLFHEIYGKPGSRVVSRFGPDAMDLESVTQSATLRYEILKVRKVDDDVVVLARFWNRDRIVVPRALVPDEALAMLKGR